MDVAIVAAFSFLMSSVVPKCVPFYIVIRNASLLIYIVSTSRIMFPCHSSICVGWSSVTVTMLFIRVVFPCSYPMLVPKMSSARSILALVTGQLGIRFLSIYFMKSLVLSWPMMSCWACIHKASEYYLMVYLDLFLSTVIIKTWAMSFLTSEKKTGPLFACLDCDFFVTLVGVLSILFKFIACYLFVVLAGWKTFP